MVSVGPNPDIEDARPVVGDAMAARAKDLSENTIAKQRLKGLEDSGMTLTAMEVDKTRDI